MSDRSKKFHEFALKHGLFKGRTDWYFCYLKSERIAHVLSVLAQNGDGEQLKDIGLEAQSLPADIAHMAAGELDVSSCLATVFGLLSLVRLATTEGNLTVDNSHVLIAEYEHLAERLVAGSNPSPFASAEDFFIPELPSVESTSFLPARLSERHPHSPASIKDTNNVLNNVSNERQSKGQNTAKMGDRASIILSYLRKQKRASIKDIATVVRGCSEKTIQRELGVLIDQGLVRRVGERRWSLYVPA